MKKIFAILLSFVIVFNSSISVNAAVTEKIKSGKSITITQEDWKVFNNDGEGKKFNPYAVGDVVINKIKKNKMLSDCIIDDSGVVFKLVNAHDKEVEVKGKLILAKSIKYNDLTYKKVIKTADAKLKANKKNTFYIIFQPDYNDGGSLYCKVVITFK